jgi:hypothetical protein
MNNIVAKLLKTHGVADNSNDYTPTFVSTSPRSTNSLNDTGVGYYTDTWFGIHNPSGTAMAVTVWTVDQGVSGSGVTVRINPGETFYSTISKITVSGDVILLGIPTTFIR